jgi:hypothetical protein
MTPEYMQALLGAKPFQPLRVRLHSGETHEIIYPNLSMVTRPSLIIAFPDPKSNGQWGEDYVEVHWSEIAGVEQMAPEGAGA